MKRVFVIGMVLLVMAFAGATSASAAPSVEPGIKQRTVSLQCVFHFVGHGKLAAMELVRDIRAESQTVAPNAASSDVVDPIVGLYRKGCGPTLNTYVRARVSSTAYYWYLQVVNLNT